jgi:polyisoprenoid-binding protein YceI
VSPRHVHAGFLNRHNRFTGELMLTPSTFARRILTASLIAFAVSGAAKADTYAFDPGHTEIRFSWNHFGVSQMSGMITNYEGRLNFDAAAPEKSTLQITAKTDSLWTHTDQLTQHLKSADFFDAAKHPEISFKTTKVEMTGEKAGRITGDMTIKGVTKPVTFDVKLVFKGNHPMTSKPALGFQAKTTIKRSEFAVGKYVPAVSDDVVITVNTEMPKQG